MKRCLTAIFIFALASAAFSYDEVEPTSFIKEEIEKVALITDPDYCWSQNYHYPYDSNAPKMPKYSLGYVFSVGEGRFLVLGEDHEYNNNNFTGFYSDGSTFLSKLSVWFYRTDDSDCNVIKQLQDKKCGKLGFYSVDLNFDEEQDFIWYGVGGTGNFVSFESFATIYREGYGVEEKNMYYFAEFAHFQDIDIEFCIINGKRGFLFTNCQGNYLTVADGCGIPDEEVYDPQKKYTEFYEYNPRTCKYELNESVGKEQIAKAVIPDDFFAYDGLKFSALGSKLSSADLEKLSKAQLRLMRNAVYARHGRTFKSTDLQSLWECYAWYKKNPAYSDDLLTDIDKYNIRLIKMFE